MDAIFPLRPLHWIVAVCDDKTGLNHLLVILFSYKKRIKSKNEGFALSCVVFLMTSYWAREKRDLSEFYTNAKQWREQ